MAKTSVILQFIFGLILLIEKSISTRIHFVHWNTTNPIFRIDNTDNIVDVNAGNLAFEYDQANIICPFYEDSNIRRHHERFIIYNVSREEYETCRITNPNPRVIAICDTPNKVRYVTITFRSFTPTPGGMEFHPGKDYYFISTSSKEDLHRRVGGWCTTHNMKMVFKVADQNNKLSQTIQPESQEEINLATEEGKEVSLDPVNYYYPAREVMIEDEMDLDPVENDLKRSDRDYHSSEFSNEVIKQEASRMHQNEGEAEGGAPYSSGNTLQSSQVVIVILAMIHFLLQTNVGGVLIIQ